MGALSRSFISAGLRRACRLVFRRRCANALDYGSGAVVSLKCRLVLPLLIAVGSAISAPAQALDDPPIQDNSFLIEEAYNQGPGVVQEIQTFLHGTSGAAWVYSFTQEWPAPSVKHQLSYGLQYARIDQSDTGAHRGIGDVALNYRYQWIGSGDSAVACSPRLTAILPTGNDEDELGLGSFGAQVNLPISVVLDRHFIAHWNLGATYFPSARAASGDEASLTLLNGGASVVWLASPRFNVMLEGIWLRNETVIGDDRVEREDQFVVSPGVRWACNFESGLQIVPGIAMPIGVGSSSDDRSIFLYLSFEHPFRRIED